jgi:DNA-binding transcriptional LysR family regulator
MELRHLRFLVAVAESGSFSAAARRLHIAQPALTRQIRDAERELGTPVFERLPRRVALTPLGTECISAAAAILDSARNAGERARLAQEGANGRAVIAVGKLPLGSGEAARLVERVKLEFPGIDLVVVGAAMEKQWELIARGGADIGIGAEAPMTDGRLHSLPLLEDRLDSAVVPASHPLGRRQSVRLVELVNEPLLWYGAEGSESDAILDRELQRRGIGIRVERPIGGIDTVVLRVVASAGWTLAPAWFRERLPASLTSVPISDFSIRGCRFAVARAGDDRPIVMTLIDLMMRMANGDPPRPAVGPRALLPRWSAQGLPEIHHLRSFVAVVTEGSLGLAAGHLGVTQPALSRQMQTLERDLGVPLLVRGTRGVTPTSGGESLFRDAAGILAAMDEFQSRGGRIQRAIEGRCVMGIVPTPTVARLGAAVVWRALRSEPHVELTVTNIDTPLQAAAVLDGSIDFAIGHAFPFATTPEKLVRESLSGGRLDTAILPATHRLAGRPAIKLHDLAGEPLVFLERSLDPSFYDLVMEAFALNGFVPTRGPAYESLEVMWAMVAAGQGWTLGGDTQRDEPPGGTVGVTISDFTLPWGVDLLYAAGESRPSVLSMLKLVREAAKANVLTREAPLADRPASPDAPDQTPPATQQPAAAQRLPNTSLDRSA